ncbi:PepSY domain-containing protein [Pseudomonas sp. C2B4]|uniref:PepSY domain-containing protein n=1 Tax=Pseudomonas sp. C2B4 TaxID=2735270 RepID=UPI001585E209|nr:PepSY domain-containing protein [Pseudomonas sp. C2B4]NUU38375.1 PepSY domain-containing protein [Pseudomonas sp. C2B4]
MKSFLPFPSARATGRLALALVAFCSVTMARDLDQDEALRLRQQGVILPLEQVLQNALDRYPGAKLLEAELEEKHGVYMYEVELLTTEGVVRELDLDAATGRLLKDKED